MKKQTVLSTLLLGIRFGLVAILATALFLPLPIVIGDYIARINEVGEYSGSLPVSWICGLAIGMVIPFSLPYVIGVCILSLIIAKVFPPDVNDLQAYRRPIASMVGVFASLGGLYFFEKFEALDAVGGWIFIVIMLVWGVLLFGWIGRRIQQSLSQSAEHGPSPNIKDEPN